MQTGLYRESPTRELLFSSCPLCGARVGFPASAVTAVCDACEARFVVLANPPALRAQPRIAEKKPVVEVVEAPPKHRSFDADMAKLEMSMGVVVIFALLRIVLLGAG